MSLRKRNKGREKYGPMYKQENIIERTNNLIEKTAEAITHLGKSGRETAESLRKFINTIPESGPELVIMSQRGGKSMQTKQAPDNFQPIGSAIITVDHAAAGRRDKSILTIPGRNCMNYVDITGMTPDEITTTIKMYSGMYDEVGELTKEHLDYLKNRHDAKNKPNTDYNISGLIVKKRFDD